MFRNTLCEAEPDEPGERSAFGAIRTGIELCERQPRQSSGSIGQPDLAPNAMPDTVLIVPAAGMRRIVAQRAEVEMPEFSFSPPNSPTLGIPVVLASRESYGRLRIASGQRRRLKQQEESGFRPRTKTRCGPHRTTTGCLYPRCRYRRPATGRRSSTTCPHRKVTPYRATTAVRTRRTSRRYCRSADTQCARPEIRVPRSTGRRPFADNPQRCLTSGDKGRPDVPCQATGLSPSQDEFSETHTEPINTRNIPVKQNGAAAMRRPPRNVSGGPQSADYPIRVSPCQLI